MKRNFCGLLRSFIASSKTHDSFDGSVFAIDPLNPKNVITKVESLKAALLVEENDDCATGPVKSLAEKFPVNRRIVKNVLNLRVEKDLLNGVLCSSDGNAVNELQR